MKLTKSGHPKSENVFELAMVFLNLSRAYPTSSVAMENPCYDVCGTPACHAGWYALYSFEGKTGGYQPGTQFIADNLGFRNPLELECWARSNDQIWGNRDGHMMFCSETAFGVKSDEALTLSKIYRHWMGVAKRLAVIEGNMA